LYFSLELDRFQYRFHPIKLVHSVVPSQCEAQPYKKIQGKLIYMSNFNKFLVFSILSENNMKGGFFLPEDASYV